MQHLKLIGLFSLLWLLTACGGGDSPFQLAEGGISGSGVGMGKISGFGSIIVNDIEYDTSQAEILIDGMPATEEQLAIGMYVTVEGTKINETQGVAQRVLYQDVVRSRIHFISAEGKGLIVAGQIILLDEETILLGFEQPSALQLGDCVRVSGPTAAPFGMTATLVERQADSACDETVVSGSLGQLDTLHQRFFIGGLSISYAQAAQLPQSLEDGLQVAVRGTLVENRLLNAAQVRALDIITPSVGSFSFIEGTVTRFNSIDAFMVEHRPVRLIDSTRDNAARIAQLGVGAQVRVAGFIDENNVLAANTLIITRPNPTNPTAGSNNPAATQRAFYRINGPLNALDLNTQQINIAGMAGYYNDNTRFYDMTAIINPFQAQHLRLGDYISALAFPRDENQQFLFSLILYQPFAVPNNRQLRGWVDQFSNAQQTLTIAGIDIVTHANTRFFDAQAHLIVLPVTGLPLSVADDMQVQANTFFQALYPRALVYAEGRANINNPNEIIADKLILLGDVKQAGG